MRCAIVICVGVLVAGSAGTALAKEANLTLSSPPGVGSAGSGTPDDPWTGTIRVTADEGVPASEIALHRPHISLIDTVSGASRSVATTATGTAGVFRFSVVFPAQGRWRYAVVDGLTSRAYQFGPAPTVAAGSGGDSTADGTPAWPFGIAAALLAAGAAMGLTLRRRGRVTPSV